MADPQQRPLFDRKISDRALILPLIGCFLLTPPLAAIFQLDIRIFGIPFTGLYLFAVWAGLIIGAARLSRQLQHGAGWVDQKPDARKTDPDAID